MNQIVPCCLKCPQNLNLTLNPRTRKVGRQTIDGLDHAQRSYFFFYCKQIKESARLPILAVHPDKCVLIKFSPTKILCQHYYLLPKFFVIRSQNKVTTKCRYTVEIKMSNKNQDPTP